MLQVYVLVRWSYLLEKLKLQPVSHTSSFDFMKGDSSPTTYFPNAAPVLWRQNSTRQMLPKEATNKQHIPCFQSFCVFQCLLLLRLSRCSSLPDARTKSDQKCVIAELGPQQWFRFLHPRQLATNYLPNIAPEKWWLEDWFSFGIAFLQAQRSLHHKEYTCLLY